MAASLVKARTCSGDRAASARITLIAIAFSKPWAPVIFASQTSALSPHDSRDMSR